MGASQWADAPDVVEDEVTFEGNARLKAVALAAHTGLPALADDSGLAVEVLGGAPGIFSARWAGRHGDDRANLDLLLAQVADVKDEHRAAAFVCAAVLALPDGTVRATEGRMPGLLAREPRGTQRLRLRPGPPRRRRHPARRGAQPRGEERDLSPGQGVSRHGPAPAGPAGLSHSSVPEGGLEPPRPRARHPKCRVSTSSTTPASGDSLRIHGQSHARSVVTALVPSRERVGLRVAVRTQESKIRRLGCRESRR